MTRQPIVRVETMTAARRNYLEHQQEAIYQDIPLGHPIIPLVKIYATGTPYYSSCHQGKPHTHTHTRTHTVVQDKSRR